MIFREIWDVRELVSDLGVGQLRGYPSMVLREEEDDELTGAVLFWMYFLVHVATNNEQIHTFGRHKTHLENKLSLQPLHLLLQLSLNLALPLLRFIFSCFEQCNLGSVILSGFLDGLA